MIFFVSSTLTLVSCDDATINSESILFRPIDIQVPTFDFRSSLGALQDESAEYPCDPIVVHPKIGIDYTIGDIQPREDIDYSLVITDPGKNWCSSINMKN